MQQDSVIVAVPIMLGGIFATVQQAKAAIVEDVQQLMVMVQYLLDVVPTNKSGWHNLWMSHDSCKPGFLQHSLQALHTYRISDLIDITAGNKGWKITDLNKSCCKNFLFMLADCQCQGCASGMSFDTISNEQKRYTSWRWQPSAVPNKTAPQHYRIEIRLSYCSVA